eukprot:TRINITY_DN11344_c0_g1_i5.p1 TRINITY_DN11344_c0_g1~~TRINITY_DN11344_c0_g1_i5.p1  ORF type:complete len:581 (-),score=122.38 TRINITY_DN11344_c0_g1_i5:233-1975(-)
MPLAGSDLATGCQQQTPHTITVGMSLRATKAPQNEHPDAKSALSANIERLGKSMTTSADFGKFHDKNLPGIIHGFEFPFTIEQMESYGPSWFTTAFRASKAIPDDVSVTSLTVTDITKKVGGGAADKAILEVTYDKPCDTPTRFFAKLPCLKISDRKQAAISNAAGPEVAFAHLFASPYSNPVPEFPVRVPKMYFCDINIESTNFLQIQECLEFSDGKGPGTLFPSNEKSQDWKIPTELILPFYTLLMKSAAQQCAWYETVKDTPLGARLCEVFADSGLLGDFPKSVHWLLRPVIFWVGRSLMFFNTNFVQTICPKLCPADVIEDAAIAQFQREFEEALYLFPEIMCHILNKDTNVMGHPNLCVDNAFFYRGEDGKEIECGGLDFGVFGSHKVVAILSGVLGSSDDPFCSHNGKEMIRIFVDEFNSKCDRKLDFDEVHQDYELMNTMKSLVTSILAVLKVSETMSFDELKQCKSERDPPMLDDFYGRSFVKLIIGGFIRWKYNNASGTVKTWAAEHVQPSIGGTVAGYVFYWPWRPFHTAFMRTQVALYNRNLLGPTWGAVALSVIGGAGYAAYQYFQSA